MADLSAIGDCLAGRISPQVAIGRMVLACVPAAEIAAMLDAAPSADPRWAAMRALVDGRRDALDALATQVRQTVANHSAAGDTAAAGLQKIAAFFDNAVAFSPEASVALYSLGDPAILAAATQEIVDWLPVPPDADVLDLGCGIGRMTAALAPRCRSILGVDVSPGMVAEARRRHPGLRFAVTDGTGLDAAPASLDLILAIDSFPYIIQTGAETVARHVGGAARALRPGGRLVILNLSYRGDPAADRADAEVWATMYGFRLDEAGTTPFHLWDGTAWVFTAAPSPRERGSG